MTRETKIGLLVGLAFIIVIGILLSEQIVQSTEPPPAPRAEVADNLRKGTATPVSQHKPVAPAVATQDPSPEATVPTREDVNRRPPVTFVNVGPGRANPNDAVVIGGGNNTNNRGNEAAGQGTSTPPETASNQHEMAGNETAGQPNTGGRRTIAEEAARMGETLIGPDGQPLRANNPLPPTGGTTARGNGTNTTGNGAGHETHVAAGIKQYKAEPGDSLSKLAQKLMGSNTKANRDAIVKANPSLAADPNKIIIGVTYNIPASATAVSPPPVTASGNTTTPPTPPRTPERATASASENVYVVQPGDNLSRIAKDRMGDLSTMAAIKELNRDAVKNWDVLPVGTKLKLPGKPIASAQ